MGKIVKIGLIQLKCDAHATKNYQKTLDHIRQAAEQGAQIVCTQELFKSPYFCKVVDEKLFELAETVNENNPTVQDLGQLAQELQIVIVAGLFEKRTLGLYHNCVVVIDADGSYLGKYRKMHIPDDPLYYEKFYFTPGDLGYKVFKTKYATIGTLICWDQWFPEAARLTAMKGAEIIFYPTAIGHIPPENDQTSGDFHNAWKVVQQGHAVANGCFVAAVNRVGFEENPGNADDKPGIDFWGGSFIADPYGMIIKEASTTAEELIVYPIDLGVIAAVRNSMSIFFRDRRTDSYQGLTQLYLDE